MDLQLCTSRSRVRAADAACSEVPPQLQHSPLLADLDLGQQCSNPEAQPERLNVLVYSHCQDLPAWLLGLEQLRKLQVGVAAA